MPTARIIIYAIISVVAIAAVGALPASASTYSYDIYLYTEGSVGYDRTGLVTGEITTNCNNCSLYPGNILSWSFTGTDPLTGAIESISSTAPNAAIRQWSSVSNVYSSNLYVTPSTIFYHADTNNTVFTLLLNQYQSEAKSLEFYYLNNHGDWFFIYDDNGQYPYTLDIDMPVTLGADLPIGTLTTPLPAALPLFATGLGVLGLMATRRRK